ncbi:hypothetical protein PF007_g21379 [Phytophthora fragariae]|uniref:Uncharacterized protein n=1 Tax=Phytophthora fragariae TaxID=53985 RepID=A0A6A3QWQ4_9STRA|nr:hypothetical protein PF007_g21379 [Phytophthora fragariae]
MSIAAELERAVGGLAALCRRSFGTCGEETLLFRPPDAPVVTGEGHAVLVAWKRGSDAHDPLTTFLLTAADGVHKQLGDASSEFILMIEAAVIHAAQEDRWVATCCPSGSELRDDAAVKAVSRDEF